MDEPQIAANMPQATIVATPDELRMPPAKAFTTANRSRPASERCMIVPVKMNSGMAISSKTWLPCQRVSVIPASAMSSSFTRMKPMSAAIPIATKTGMPIAIIARKRTTMERPVVMSAGLFGFGIVAGHKYAQSLQG